MDNQLILTDLWLDDSVLMANDSRVGLIALCSEDSFCLGPNDSLKKHWTESINGVKYRKIRGTKRCYSPLPIAELKRLTIETGLITKVEKSYCKLKNSHV